MPGNFLLLEFYDVFPFFCKLDFIILAQNNLQLYNIKMTKNNHICIVNISIFMMNRVKGNESFIIFSESYDGKIRELSD